jgi:hypothetical protein
MEIKKEPLHSISEQVAEQIERQGPALPLKFTPTEWQDSSGSLITLCVIHELLPNQTHRVPSMIVAAGMSLCREHFHQIIQVLQDGYTIEEVLTAAKEDQL